MADKVYYNPSLGIQSISPSIDDETFLFFLETYYNWMQTTDITYNASDGPFTQGEIITGQDSRATATVRYVDSSNNMITVSMKTDKSFDVSEEIVGGTSSNSAFVLEMSDNILRKASRLRENKNPQKAQGLFLEYLKQELNKGIPTLTQTDRRKLVSQLRDFFKSKSTEEAYSFLFRALFNETIEIRYPGDDLLRVSDGNFVKQSTIRVGERSAFSIAGTANVISGNAYVFGTNTEFTSISNSDHIRIGTQQAIVANVINNSILVATTNFNTSANNQFLEFLPTFDVFSLKNKTIRGRTSGAVAVVADLRVSFLGGLRYADLVLRLISGEFQENEIVEDIETTNANTIVYGVVSTITINDGGTGYAVDDDIVINGDGAEARAKVSSVSEAPISKILLANTGIGYRNNIEATVNNSGTGGTGLRVRINEIANTYTVGSNNEYTVGDTVSISIINRGSGYKALPTITLQDTAVSALGLLHEKLIRIDDAGTLYEVGDPLVFAGGSGTSVAGQVAAVTERWAETPVTLVASEVVEPYKDESLLSDFGSLTVITEGDVGILLEQDYEDRLKMEDWRAVGPIERIELTNFGSGYTYPSGLPTVTVTSANGIGASLTVFDIQGRSAVIEIDAANNVAGIGAIREVTILDQGINYTSATVDATGSGDGNANLTADISGIFTNPGYFQNDDGKVNYKVLQDSLFYQDFSYVIRSGLSFDQYKDVVKESIHPAGLEFFGEIVITSTISAVANFTSEINAEAAPRFISIFSFLSLWEAYGLPPPVISSIVVKIKPVVSYTDNAKLDTHREINVEIAPTVIDVGAETSTEYRPILAPSIDVGIFGGASVTVIATPPAENEYDIILNGANLSIIFDTGAVREIDITPEVTNLQINSINFIPQLSSLSETILNVVPTTQYEIDILPVNTINARYAYGEVPILQFAQTSIAELMNVSFEDYYYYGVGTPTPTLNLLDIDIPLFTSLPVTVYESETFGNNFTYKKFINVTSQEHREVVIQPVINIPSTFFNDREIIVRIENFFDATMAFYSIITTAETDTRTVEIDVNLLQSVSVVTIEIPREIEISQEPLSVSSLEIKEYNIEISLFNVATVQTTDVITEIDVNLLQSVSITPIQNYEIETQSLINLLNQSDKQLIVNLTPTVNQAISVISFEQLGYEREIKLSSNVSIISTQNPLELEYLIDGKQSYGDVLISQYASDPISVHEGTRFGSIAPRDLIKTHTEANFVTGELKITPPESLLILTTEIDSDYRTIFKKSVDVGLYGNSSIDAVPAPLIPKNVSTIYLNGQRYYEKTIEEFSSLPIGMYDGEPFSDKIAWGRATFETGRRKKEKVTYEELDIFALSDKTLFELIPGVLFEDGDKMIDENGEFLLQEENIGFEDIYRQDKMITKNRKISGIIDVTGNTVIGTNTDFVGTFFAGDVIIIETEKFIVSYVTNSEHMMLNVAAVTNYTNVSAYREYFV